MQNAEVLTREQLREFLKGSAGIEFHAQNRAELYGWVQGVLVAQEYAVQDKKAAWSDSSLPEQTHWTQPAASDALDPPIPAGGYGASGRVPAAALSVQIHKPGCSAAGRREQRPMVGSVG